MEIPNWIFKKCEKKGFFKREKGRIVWDTSINPAYMIMKMINEDRKRRKSQIKH